MALPLKLCLDGGNTPPLHSFPVWKYMRSMCFDNGDLVRPGRDADRDQPPGHGGATDGDSNLCPMYEEAPAMLVSDALPNVPAVILIVSRSFPHS